jgi:hypothetical protein
VKLNCTVKIEAPNSSMSSFEGKVKLKGFPTSVTATNDNFILSGSTVMGVPWILVLVLYTGPETKLQHNLKPPRKKISRIEKLIN